MSDTRQTAVVDKRRAEPDTVERYLEGAKAKIMAASPDYMNADSLIRVFMGLLTTGKAAQGLQQCSLQSVLSSMMQCAALGLEPGPLQHAYLIPYGGVCTFQPGWQGLVHLGQRIPGGMVVTPRVVYDKDEFSVTYHAKGKPYVHVPCLTADRGERLGVYAEYTTGAGLYDFEWVPESEIQKMKGASQNSQAWKIWEDEMAKKGAIKRLMKRAPKSPQMVTAIHLDNQSERGERQDSPPWMDTAMDEPVKGPSDRPSPPGDVEYDQGPKDDAPPAKGKSSAQSTQDGIHAIGRKLYPKTWDKQRHKACLWASNDKTLHIKELQDNELQRLMNEMQQRELDVAAGKPIQGQEVE